MPHYQHHVFVCTNLRDPYDSRESCAQKGSETLCKAFKGAVKASPLADVVRVSSSGCLGQCAKGPTVVVYPEQVWYSIHNQQDIERIVNEHLLGGKVVHDLEIIDNK